MNPIAQEVAPQNQTEFSPFAQAIYESKYSMLREDGTKETWPDTAHRVTLNVLDALKISDGSYEFQKILELITARKFLPGGRYLYASGRGLHQVNNCVLLDIEDSREGWADLLHKASMSLMTGAGIGVSYSKLRASGTPIIKTGGEASGPISIMKMVNEIGRHVMQGGSRRSAIWAGLNWQHPDCETFIKAKDWSPEVRALKEKDFNFPADLDMTNISVELDDEFFVAFENKFHSKHELAQHIYWTALKRMIKTGEPGFSINVGDNAREVLRNACTELTSADDSDICNLGSLNLANFAELDDFRDAVFYGTLFLLAGTVYSDLPYEGIKEVRKKNRRLGLGLMGIHEWLLKRGYKYEPNGELEEWLKVYQRSTEYAHYWADQYGLSRPVKTRAIAPNGTISIVAETTSGMEPIFCVAYKRRYKEARPDGDVTRYQYVIDPTAKRLIAEGVDPNDIEDAYMLAYNVERRVAMQAFLQKYVDHSISSTINLPYAIEDEDEAQDFGDMLYNYLPKLRGITVFPDGARGGQPLTAIPYDVAIGQEGVEFIEDEAKCSGSICGA